MRPDLTNESALWKIGYHYIAGVDEVGRGPIAGPVTVGAVILPSDQCIVDQLSGVKDSKKMTAKQRNYWANVILDIALSWGIGFASVKEIDENGITRAVCLAASRALDMLKPAADYLLIDYIKLPAHPLPQVSLVKGDELCLSIAAASVIAKITRDDLMIKMERVYPDYGFARHKGYGTQAHRQALARLGPCPIHRRSFAPINQY